MSYSDNYNKFKVILKKIEKEILSKEEYIGYPPLPDRYHDLLELYEKSDSDEQRYMFVITSSILMQALCHWKSDIDKLWTDKGHTAHSKFLEDYSDVLQPMNPNKDSFNIGI
jgi:5'-deoxynucleotidase YfbR-like HD superfamily hydrolase